MATTVHEQLHAQLLERRRRLEAATAVTGLEEEARRLLTEVDAALARYDEGTFGLCATCGGPVEEDRLAADPLVRFCLDHLSTSQRRALEQDVELAARIQGAFLPERSLRAEGWEVAYRYEGSGPMSGDTCDVGRELGGDVHFLVGDVAGKGLAASLLMAHLHATFRALRPLGLPLAEMVGRASRAFCESTTPEAYATLFCGVARPSGQVEVCNAGHPPALWLRGDEVDEVPATGLPVGLFCDAAYAVRTLALAPGDTLLLYPDGLIESESAAGAAYGTDRLARLVAARGGLSPEERVDACVADLKKFRGGPGIQDDVTIMAIHRGRR